MKLPKIDIDETKLRNLAREFAIKELYLFGSVLRPDFNEQSDIDIMVSFRDNVHYSYFDFFEIRERFKNIFQRDVDLIEKESLKNPYRKKAILSTARKIYADN